MKTSIAAILLFSATLVGVNAQSYPYWDSSEPGRSHNPDYGISGPFLATTNAIFCIRAYAAGGIATVTRWTKCGGWEELPNLWMDDVLFSGLHNASWIAIQDHYLYLVGSLHLTGYGDVSVAKFDLNTGAWSPVSTTLDTSYRTPITVAVDTMNRIYVGFWISGLGPGFSDDIDSPTGCGYADQDRTDLLEVSTDNGTSWQTVGYGFHTMAVQQGSALLPAVTALTADGTNVYVGGDFVAAVGGPSSSHVIAWTGSAWLGLDGVYPGEPTVDPFQSFGSISGLDTVNSIVNIGTNIYVAGIFSSPQKGIARFSNVTGKSLSVGGLSPNGLYTFGESLAVNNGKLCVGGQFTIVGLLNNLACLQDPQDANADDWTSLSGVDCLTQAPIYVIAATNGNAIYVCGVTGLEGSDGFSRWVVGPDGPSPSAQITSVTPTAINVVGTPQSHWQIVYSSDNQNWSASLGEITIWNGTGVFNLAGYYSHDPFPHYWKLTDNCSESPVFTVREINVQFAGGTDGQPAKTGAAAVGFADDYWNVLPALDGEEDEVGDPGSGIYAIIECHDSFGNTTPITVDLQSWGDPPGGGPCGWAVQNAKHIWSDPNGVNLAAATDPLMQGLEIENAGSPIDIYVTGLDRHTTYDIYLYGCWQTPYMWPSRMASQFQIVTNFPFGQDVAFSSPNPQQTDAGFDWDINNWQEGKQYVVFRNVHFTSSNGGTRNVDIHISSSGQYGVWSWPGINGLQIVPHY